MADQLEAGTADGLRVGFVGLGTMGRPMCAHIARKHLGEASSGAISAVWAYDQFAGAAADLADLGVVAADDLCALIDHVDVLHLCLPGGAELEAVCRDEGGLLAHARAGQAVIDHGTSPVPLTRDLAASFAQNGVGYADAPITRTRQAAEAGTLVTLFGGPADLLDRVAPVMRSFSAEIVHCGDVGTGQIFKQLNNMVLFQTVVALAEALATARAAGVDGAKLFDAFTQGSADSFALRNHGMKALLPGAFPERAFATRYAIKDLDYALELAAAHGLDLRQGQATRERFEAAISAGLGDAYFPSVLQVIAPGVDRGSDAT